ncbi:MAG TPA: tRNA pseudouridine(38-40) synthase TruA [Myxococcales bacterium]|nr:tRNA pseudouridine(38-40) synthase TruA [Myxococcales bacterium]
MSDVTTNADSPRVRFILIWVAFDGAAFHGFQRQRSIRTVAGTLEQAWLTFQNEQVDARSSSRTDAGVHCRRMPVLLRTVSKIELKGIRFGLDHHLPEDLSVVDAEEVDASFHVRHDAIGTRYIYRIWSGRARDPTLRRDHWHVPWKLDISAMSEAAAMMTGEHDYAAFRTSACTAQSTVRSLNNVQVHVDQQQVEIVVEGNAFLHNMVRIIAGTLIEVGQGRRTSDDVCEALRSGRRQDAGITAPAHGLTLDKVRYGPYGSRQGLQHKTLLARLVQLPPTNE